jgi:hypothetical protein
MGALLYVDQSIGVWCFMDLTSIDGEVHRVVVQLPLKRWRDLVIMTAVN